MNKVEKELTYNFIFYEGCSFYTLFLNPKELKMKKQTIALILFMSCQIFGANRSTFVNMQTSTGIVYYPTIVSVSESEIKLATGSTVNIEDVNSVMAYSESKSIMPMIWGAGCCYLGQIPGWCVGLLLFPSITSWSGEDAAEMGLVVSALVGAVLSGTYAYRRSVNRISERSQTMVFMGGWTLEQKRNFFISAITLG